MCVKALTKALNGIIEQGNAPVTWKNSKTVLIPKTAKPKVKDFRLIALTNTGYKIFMGLLKCIIVQHLYENGELCELQSGFTAGRRVEGNLFMLNYCIKKSKRENSISYSSNRLQKSL